MSMKIKEWKFSCRHFNITKTSINQIKKRKEIIFRFQLFWIQDHRLLHLDKLERNNYQKVIFKNL